MSVLRDMLEFVDAVDAKSKRVSSRPMAVCQCGRMLKMGWTGPWNCGPSCAPKTLAPGVPPTIISAS